MAGRGARALGIGPMHASALTHLRRRRFSDLAELAVDADRLVVQRARLRQIAREQPGRSERAQAACQGLAGAERAQQSVGLAQQPLPLVGAARPGATAATLSA